MRQHGGYLMVDHRASPGLPEDVARWAGYDPALCREGKLFEADTLRCAHCPAIVIKNPLRTRERCTCQKCSGRFICDPCAFRATLPDYVHAPLEKALDEIKDRAAMGSPPSLLIPPSS
jgi:hypothetical protein